MNALVIAAAGASLVLAGALASSTIAGERPRTGAVLEVQLGPVIVGLGGLQEPLLVAGEPACFTQGCALFAVRAGSPALGGPPGEAARVKRAAPGDFKSGGLVLEIADERLGEQGRMGEAARAEPGQNM